MRVWNGCCGNEKTKLKKTSSSLAELSDLGLQAQSDSTAALSCTQSGDRHCLHGYTPPSLHVQHSHFFCHRRRMCLFFYAQLRSIISQSVQLAMLLVLL